MCSTCIKTKYKTHIINYTENLSFVRFLNMFLIDGVHSSFMHHSASELLLILLNSLSGMTCL